MREFLLKHSPPGVDIEVERNWFIGGLVCAWIYSSGFLFRFSWAKNALYEYRQGMRIRLLPDAMVPDFTELLGRSLYGFYVLALMMIGVILLHYASHWQGSKSIYLMRRLPSRWELHRRCILLPVLAMGISLAAAGLTLAVYFAAYMLTTPDGCLPPDQWQKLWSVLL